MPTMSEKARYFLRLMCEDKLIYRDGTLWWRYKRGKPLRAEEQAGALNVDGYRRVHGQDRRSGKQYNMFAHQIIWTYFNGPIPPGYEINHLGGKDDNYPHLLELKTPRENKIDAGRRELLDGKPAGKCYSPAQVIEVRRLFYEQGVSRCEIARRLGMDRKTVKDMVNYRTWRNLRPAEPAAVPA